MIWFKNDEDGFIDLKWRGVILKDNDIAIEKEKKLFEKYEKAFSLLTKVAIDDEGREYYEEEFSPDYSFSQRWEIIDEILSIRNPISTEIMDAKKGFENIREKKYNQNINSNSDCLKTHARSLLDKKKKGGLDPYDIIEFDAIAEIIVMKFLPVQEKEEALRRFKFFKSTRDRLEENLLAEINTQKHKDDFMSILTFQFCRELGMNPKNLSPIYSYDKDLIGLTLITCNNFNKNRIIVKAFV